MIDSFSLYEDCVMFPYDKNVRENCLPFSCGEVDLNEFFQDDADYMRKNS